MCKWVKIGGDTRTADSEVVVITNDIGIVFFLSPWKRTADAEVLNEAQSRGKCRSIISIIVNGRSAWKHTADANVSIDSQS